MKQLPIRFFYVSFFLLCAPIFGYIPLVHFNIMIEIERTKGINIEKTHAYTIYIYFIRLNSIYVRCDVTHTKMVTKNVDSKIDKSWFSKLVFRKFK